MQNGHARRKPSFHEAGRLYPPFPLSSIDSSSLSLRDSFAAFPYVVPETSLVSVAGLRPVFPASVLARRYQRPAGIVVFSQKLFEGSCIVFRVAYSPAHLIAPQ